MADLIDSDCDVIVGATRQAGWGVSETADLLQFVMNNSL